MFDLVETVKEYLSVLDSSLEKLSNKYEGKISNLPSWMLAPRNVSIGTTLDGQGVVLKVEQNPELDNDIFHHQIITSEDEMNEIISPWKTDFQPGKLSSKPFMMVGDLTVVDEKNPLAVPVKEDKNLVGYGNIEQASNTFSVSSAKSDALNFWNHALNNQQSSGSYIHETRVILLKFQLIIKRKNFLERKIHRYINEHRNILLPSFSRCYYEHILYLGEDQRKADFILEREDGLPPILIELENPTHKVFRKDGEPTYQTNHAKNQIAEWIQFIDQDSQRNASGEFSFLTGPKQRLVVLGRGLEHREKLINTKFSDTTIWTYELFLAQAKNRLNEEFASQCRLIGIDEVRPF